MTFDISQIRPGDELTLKRVKVEQIDRTDGSLPIEVLVNIAIDRTKLMWIAPWAIAAWHPDSQDFGIGDLVAVERNGSGKTGRIEHVARGLARVLWTGGGESLNSFSELTLMRRAPE